MSKPKSWMLYGAAGHTGSVIARHAQQRGHRPLLAGRNASAIAAQSEKLELECRVLCLDDPAALVAALSDVDLVLNAAGPFLHTASPLAEACLDAGVHYLDISNELQVFRAMYELDERAHQAGVAIIPGVGFGVVATNCLARYVSDAVGGAMSLEVGSRIASAQPGPGAAATMRENLPYGGWVRQGGELQRQQLGSGITTIVFPDGTFGAMPVPTGDLEAAFQATAAANITAYSVTVEAKVPGVALAEQGSIRSFGWARATGTGGERAEAWLETGESYAFTADASIRAVEETLAQSITGVFSPAAAFGSDFVLKVDDTSRIEQLEAFGELG
jgi:short subunit dehydrogenase-like uncharacterized protein